MQIGNKEPVPGSLLTIFGFILVSGFFLFHQHVRHLSASNEYYEVNMEEVFINMKLIIGNRESGTGSLFLI